MNSLSPNIRGAIFMMLSMAGYVLNDAMMKTVSGELSLFQAVFIRGLFACTLMSVLAWYMGALKTPQGMLATLRRPALVLRVLAEVLATWFFLVALFNMPIANVTAVLQLLPLTITLGAAVFFGETVGWRRYLAILIGFLGVLLIIRPGSDGFNIFALSALAATACVTFRDLLTRQLPKDTPSLFISLMTAIAIMVFGAIGSVFEEWHPVQSHHLLALGFAAFVLMGGYIFSVSAMRDGEVSFVSPFRYSILIWAILLGVVFFNEIPDTLSMIGALIIVGSGLFTFYREQVALRRRDKNPL